MTDAIQLAPFDEDSSYQARLGFFAGLRESRPVAPVQMPGYGRAWIVTRYADVRTVLTDPRLAKDVRRWPGGGRSRPCEATGVCAHMLHADPPEHTRLPAAVEELLRFTNPVNHANDRFTTEDVPVGDVVIPAGEWVIPAISSANTDPARFPGQDRLDLDRDTSGHLAFGHGVHYCLGAPLARMEAEVALGALLARFPRISPAVPPAELRWRPVSVMNGLESLPVRLA